MLRMSADIIVNLQLDKELPSSRVIAAKEFNGCDSSFIVSCVLGHCIKNKKAVIVVSMHNFLSHYQNAGLKMNYNLQKQMENGLIDFYNYGQEKLNNLMCNEITTVDTLLNNLEEKLNEMKKKYENVNIIFDGLSHLFDLQFSLKEVNMFCKKVIENVQNQNGSFVLFHLNVEDDVTHAMASLLSHMAYTVVDVESLASGWSTDVSGHLTITHPGQKFTDEHMFNMELKPSKYLFKLFDRGVRLFAPGTV
ncbi:hypothetical protein O0L34_g4958 [Tuta absoluta]|nr:hypothetical protein O0L34_g4958 [Tuta absoluta]